MTSGKKTLVRALPAALALLAGCFGDDPPPGRPCGEPCQVIDTVDATVEGKKDAAAKDVGAAAKDIGEEAPDAAPADTQMAQPLLGQPVPALPDGSAPPAHPVPPLMAGCVERLLEPARTRLIGAPGRDLVGGSEVYATMAGDFDGDQDLDFVVTGAVTGLYRNDGRGNFTRELIYEGELLVLQAADLDGDGALDLVGSTTTPDGADTTLELLHNDGKGAFTPRVLAQGEGAIAAGVLVDEDRDGQQDLLVSWRRGPAPLDPMMSTYAVYLYTSLRGTPRERMLFPGGNGDSGDSGSLAAGDLDGDGRLDLVFGRKAPAPGKDPYHDLLWNEGGGTFTKVGPLPYLGWAPLVADVDGDGALEVGGSETLLHNLKMRNFEKESLPGAYRGEGPTIAADIDKDGDLDLVVRDDNQLVVMRQDMPMRFTLGRLPIPGLPSFLFNSHGELMRQTTGDIDGDGRVDLIFTDTGRRMHAIGADLIASSFDAKPGVKEVFTGSFPIALRGADLDGDGDVDLALIGDGQVGVMANDGHGVFARPVRLPRPPGQGVFQQLVVADLDGDGKPDLAGAQNKGLVVIYRNSGAMAFTMLAQPQLAATNPPVVDLAAGDLDGNGHADLVVAHGGFDKGGGLTVLWNDGSGTFAAAPTFSAQPSLRAVAVAKLDKQTPVIVALDDSILKESVRLFRAGASAITAGDVYPVDATVTSLAVGDLDGDAAAEIVVGGNLGRAAVTVLWNDGAARFPRSTGHEAGWWIQALALGDVDGDGQPDILAGGSRTGDVSVLLNDGRRSFFSGPAQMAADPQAIFVGDLDGRCGPDLAVVNSANFSVWIRLAGGPRMP